MVRLNGRIEREMSGFVGAVQFLTRIPIRTASPAPWRRIVGWLPLVGLLIGAALGAVHAGMLELTQTGSVAAAVTVIAGMLITGAFHEDGLADVADAIAGGSTPADRRRILDDPRHGTYGVAALTGSIVVRVVSLAALGQTAGAVALVLAHGLGRAGAVALMGLPAASDNGLGAIASREAATRVRLTGCAIAFIVGVALAGWWALVVTGVVAVAVCVVAFVTHRAFGGINGDVLGTLEQVGEAVTLVTCVALAAHHSLPAMLW